MKPPKLYIKFFLSFTFILIITLLMILGLHRITEERARASFIREQVRLYTFERMLLLKELIEEKIRSRSDKNSSGITDANMHNLIDNIAKINTAKVWLTSNNRILIKSFKGDISEKLDDLSDENKFIYEGISLYQGFNETRDIYAVSPIKGPAGENIAFHILFGERKVERQETGFIPGLILIGIIIPILVIPISRFITERVKQLKQSALRIASGDLSYRIDVKGHDEIGELGKAFNQMADKVERMIGRKGINCACFS